MIRLSHIVHMMKNAKLFARLFKLQAALILLVMLILVVKGIVRSANDEAEEKVGAYTVESLASGDDPGC